MKAKTKNILLVSGILIAAGTIISILSLQIDSAADIRICPSDQPLEQLEISVGGGDLSLQNITADTASVSNQYGDAELDNCKINTLSASLESGDFTGNALTADLFSLENEYGNSSLTDFSGNTASFTLESGDLYLDAKALYELSCEMEYGDVDLLLSDDTEDYAYDLITEYGDIKLPFNASSGYYKDDYDEAVFHADHDSGKLISIHSESGDIKIQKR